MIDPFSDSQIFFRMAKRLRVEQAKREYTTNSLWWLNNVQEMFFLILSHLPIKDIVKCRLVCHAWSSWALHDLVWSRHVDRISTFYPFFKSEFVDVLPKQTVGPGRLVEYDVPAKRRKAGGKRKVSPKKNETLSHSGNWYAVRAFLNNKLAIAKAQTIHGKLNIIVTLVLFNLIALDVNV